MSPQILDSSQIPNSHLECKWCHGAVVEALDPHGMIPTSTSHTYKVIEIIHILWVGTGIYHHAITTTFVGNYFKCPLIFKFTPGVQMKSWCSGWGSNPHGMVPTSILHIYKVFQIIPMLWIDTGIHHHAISTSHSTSAKNQLTPGVQMKSWCSGWGSRSTCNDSYIHFTHHIKSNWDHSYSVDQYWDPSSCHYHNFCWQ